MSLFQPRAAEANHSFLKKTASGNSHSFGAWKNKEIIILSTQCSPGWTTSKGSGHVMPQTEETGEE